MLLILANSTLGHILPAERIQRLLASEGVAAIVVDEIPDDFSHYDGILDCGHHRSEHSQKAIRYFAAKQRYFLHIQNPVFYNREQHWRSLASAVFSVFDVSGCIHIGHLLDDEPRQYEDTQQLKTVLYLSTGQPQTIINLFAYNAFNACDDIEVTFCHRKQLPQESTNRITVIESLPDAYNQMLNYDLVVAGTGSGVINECLHRKQASIVLPVSYESYHDDLMRYQDANNGYSLPILDRRNLVSMLDGFKVAGRLKQFSESLTDSNLVPNAGDRLRLHL